MKKPTVTAIENQHRQGDVLVSPAVIPANAKRIKLTDRLILAYGEVTGHTHRIEDLEGAEAYELEDGRVMIRLGKEVPLLHEEHIHPRPLHTGDFEVILQCEEMAGDVRQVLD